MTFYFQFQQNLTYNFASIYLMLSNFSKSNLHIFGIILRKLNFSLPLGNWNTHLFEITSFPFIKLNLK